MPRRLAPHWSLCVVLAALCFATGMARGQPPAAPDWPHWRGPNYDGIHAQKDWLGTWPNDGPKVVWKASVGTGFSSFAVVAGKLYTMGNSKTDVEQDVVYCLDAATGQTVWKHVYPCKLDPKQFEGGPGATPTVFAGMVITFSREGHVWCLKADTGQVVWSRKVGQDDLEGYKPPTWGFAGSAFIWSRKAPAEVPGAEHLVILNAGSGGVALDLKDGKTVWKSKPGVAGYATAVPFNAGPEQVLALLTGTELLLIDPATGKTRAARAWVTNWDINAADPVVVGDKLFVSSSYSKGKSALLSVDAQTGTIKPVWENKEFKLHFNPPVLIDGHLYGFHELGWLKGVLRCVDVKDGKVKWSQDDIPLGALAAADGKLIVISGKGELIIAEATPSQFKALARAPIFQGDKVRCWTAPLLSGSRLYVRNAVGDVVCLEMK